MKRLVSRGFTLVFAVFGPHIAGRTTIDLVSGESDCRWLMVEFEEGFNENSDDEHHTKNTNCFAFDGG